MKRYGLKNVIISSFLSLFFYVIAREIVLDYNWFLIIYIYIVSLLIGHITINTIKPEVEIKTPEPLETVDKFVAIPLIGMTEWAIYGGIIWILDIFFQFTSIINI